MRLLLAAGLGGVIGIDRELKDRPAGLRTHMMVSLAAALFTIITFEIFYQVRGEFPSGNVDPIRIIEAVTAGVAFLAAGSIIVSGRKIQGLTTGAGMWLAGAIGLACGGGYYYVAIVAVVISIVILAFVKRLEDRIFPPEPPLDPKNNDEA
ncbi:MgtC/SapB transporter [Candidatus Filomicrobium marinum]|uniref:Protein MgtC n=2 Tax=Filomicrobium TaxID=119044 RepID=A0A0D6JIJ3_9HYPH|nr:MULTISPECIES: MgtC/SapB family protein [Filomicrobium]MCV0371443.1 MgtC/SapB family protein [Filomicrobium sp.]CFX35939.1 MgtC/SapB transporter [Candidatus Filomicrobium marinum]CPR21778.1 MgtC/SapB transporter [Candidatus Filomicrobium marinum]SDP64052.1 putative Mg2+ transporter-C (MgtC) family protein [Filomicrobium insigne]